jgi:transglycosylase-like protein with SLT domain
LSALTHRLLLRCTVVGLALSGSLALARPALADTPPDPAQPGILGTGATGLPGLPADSIQTTPAPPPVAPPKIAISKAQQVTGHKIVTPATGVKAAVTTTTSPAAAKPAPAATGFSASASAPTALAASLMVGSPAPVPVAGVPNFFVGNFGVPPFLLPIYQAAGVAYDVPWQVLAAINQIETDFGRNLSPSSAGGLGWMQILPQAWTAYAVDANGDGVEDPYNPADAIFTAARFLAAAGAGHDIDGALRAFNPASWFAGSVHLRAQLIGGLPADLLDSVTGLTEGVMPVAGAVRFAAGPAAPAPSVSAAAAPSAAILLGGPATDPTTDIYAKADSQVVAVNAGVITALGNSPTLGRYVTLTDVFGNTYTYGRLATLATTFGVRTGNGATAAHVTRELVLQHDPAPTGPASAGHQNPGVSATVAAAVPVAAASASPSPTAGAGLVATDATNGLKRLFAHPTLPAAFAAGGSAQVANTGPAWSSHPVVAAPRTPRTVREPLVVGAQVAAGTVLGRLGAPGDTSTSSFSFQIRPAGEGAPAIDAAPILKSWQLLAAATGHASNARAGVLGGPAEPAIGRILLATKAQLQQEVLADPSIDIYAAGRTTLADGLVDQRVLAALAFLSASGLHPTVSAFLVPATTTATTLDAPEPLSPTTPAIGVDISAINGIPLLGHQGVGTITDVTIRHLLSLPGSFQPPEIISLMNYPSTPATVASSDHPDRISLVYPPADAQDSVFDQPTGAVLSATQWTDLLTRLGQIASPDVAAAPSTAAVTDPPRP